MVYRLCALFVVMLFLHNPLNASKQEDIPDTATSTPVQPEKSKTTETIIPHAAPVAPPLPLFTTPPAPQQQVIIERPLYEHPLMMASPFIVAGLWGWSRHRHWK